MWRLVSWLALVAASLTLMTNARYLSFLEPAVSRRLLGLGVCLAAAAAVAVERIGLPGSPDAWRSRLRVLAPWLALAAILATAFWLRVWGITSGLPQSYPADEWDFVNRALKMIKTGDFAPGWWHHPTLHRYLSALTYAVVFLAGVGQGRWARLHEVAEADMLYWGRFLSVVIDVTTVLAVFFLARRLLGTRLALLASALLAVFPLAVENAQYNKPDPLVTLFVVLVVLASLWYLDRPGPGRALLCGVLLGLAASSKWNGAVVLLPLLIALVAGRGRRTLASPDLYLAGAASVLALYAGSPFLLKQIDMVLNDIASSIHIYGVIGRAGAEGVDNWRSHGQYLFRYGAGAVASLAAVLGLVVSLYRVDARRAVVITFPVVYYAYYSSQRVNHLASLLPVMPFVAVFAAQGLGLAADRLSRLAPPARRPVARMAATAVLAVAATVGPVRRVVAFNEYVTQRDTGSFAADWIESSIPPGTRIAVEDHCPVLDPARYEIVRVNRIINRDLEEYRRDGVEYLIVTSLRYARYEAGHPQTEKYRRLFDACRLVREIGSEGGRIPGPEVRILEIPRDDTSEAGG